jgi:hypothetical protein
MSLAEWVNGTLKAPAEYIKRDRFADEKCPVKVITCDHLPKIKFSKNMLKIKKPKSRKRVSIKKSHKLLCDTTNCIEPKKRKKAA